MADTQTQSSEDELEKALRRVRLALEEEGKDHLLNDAMRDVIANREAYAAEKVREATTSQRIWVTALLLDHGSITITGKSMRNAYQGAEIEVFTDPVNGNRIYRLTPDTEQSDDKSKNDE